MPPNPEPEHVVLLVDVDLDRFISGKKMPKVIIGIDVSWDKEVKSWRADWKGGVQFGETKEDAIINGFRQRITGI